MRVSNQTIKLLPTEKNIVSKALSVADKHEINSIIPFAFVFPQIPMERKMEMIHYGGQKGSIFLDVNKIIDKEETPNNPYVIFFPKKVSLGNLPKCASPLTLRETLSVYTQKPALIEMGGATIMGSHFKDGKQSSLMSLVRCENYGPRLSIITKEAVKRPSFCTPVERMVAL